jgi:hypothetical protein
MELELLQSHGALPAAAALEVAALLKLSPGVVTTPHAGQAALHVGMCLDHSGSMGEQSGVSSMNKLEALKVAVQGALQLLEGCGASVTVSAFSDGETTLCAREQLKPGAGVAATLCSMVEGLDVSGGTEAVASMKPVMDALLPRTHAARRLVLVTDGQFNSGSVKVCQKLAQQAGEHGIAMWVFATGVTYNEAYLRDLVQRGAPGGLFCHVTDLRALHTLLEEELRAISHASARDITVTFRRGAGCVFSEVVRLVPTQAQLPLLAGTVTDTLDVLDARGQAYVVRVQGHGLALGTQPLLSVDVQWMEGGQRQARTLETRLTVLPAGSPVAAPNGVVMTTVLSAHAAQATVMGNGTLATQLYAAAGQTALAQKLTALGTALPTSDAARAMRTEVLGSTRLVALGSAHAPKGGTP